MKVSDLIRINESVLGAITLYHGTSGQQFKTGQFNSKDVYLTDDRKEALETYAHGRHLGGSAGGKPRILKIKTTPGKILFADDEVQSIVSLEHEEFEDLDELMDRARTDGYRYVEFTHPSTTKQDYHKVIVSLHPNEDLTIVG